jgi:hypothetical protein
MAVEKFNEAIDPFSVKGKFGGGSFNIMVKDGPELIYDQDFEIEGEPRAVPGSTDSAARPVGSDVAMEAMRMMSNPEMMKGMFEMYKTASLACMDMIRGQMPVAQDPLQTLRNAKEILAPVGVAAVAAPSRMESLLEKFMEAMILKAMNPPETNAFKETLGLIGEIRGSGLLGAPKTDLATTFVTTLPSLVTQAVTGLHEIRLNSEATLNAMRLQQDGKTIDLQPNPQPAAPAPSQPAAPATAETVSPEMVKQILVTRNLQMLVAGIKEPDSTGEEMYRFLDDNWPEIIPQMTSFSKEQLLILFRSPDMQKAQLGNTILMEVANDPRLPHLIEEFLAVAKKNAATV